MIVNNLHIRFSPYHNRHIKMLLRDGRIISGLVIDCLDKVRKVVGTQYAFIPSKYIREWLEAHRNGDSYKKSSFEKVFDIRNIQVVKHLR